MNYDEAAKKWEIFKPMPFVNLVSPRFCSENPDREDKEANIFDVRVDQIRECVDLDMVQNSIRELSGEGKLCLEKKYTCQLEYNLFGDPAFDPYSPSQE